MPQKTICQLLGNTNKIDDSNFWTGLERCCSKAQQLTGRLSMKSKENLISAIKYACTTSKTSTYIDTIIKMLDKISESENFLKNFVDTDEPVFQTINLLMLNVFEKEQSKVTDDRQISLITAIYHLFTKSPIILNYCGPYAVKQLIMLITKRKEPYELLNRAIGLIFATAEIPEVATIISQFTNHLQDVIIETKFPRIQLQILELFWRIQIPLGGFNFQNCDSQIFIGEAHKLMNQLNEKKENHIFNIPFKKISLPDGSEHGDGWIDIGFNDLVLCFDDTVISIDFNDVDGLEHNEGVFKITLAAPYEDLKINKGDVIELEFGIDVPTNEVAMIFSRISGGESENCTQEQENPVQDIPLPDLHDFPEKSNRSSIAIKKQSPELTNENIEPQNVESEVEKPITNKPRSSIALFIPESNQSSQFEKEPNVDTFDLFARSESSSSDSTFSVSENSFTTPESLTYSDNESPPLPEIDMTVYPTEDFQSNINIENYEILKEKDSKENEKNEFINDIKGNQQNSKKKSEKDADNQKLKRNVLDSPMSEPNVDDGLSYVSEYFGQYPKKASASLEGGIKTLTEYQINQIDVFTENLQRRVDTFKEDLQSTINERANGTLKQIDSSKARFHDNIQSFKRREAGIYQSLNSYEESTRNISQRLTQLQRAMRLEIQKNRKSLENELSNLRKLVHHDEDELEDDLSNEY